MVEATQVQKQKLEDKEIKDIVQPDEEIKKKKKKKNNKKKKTADTGVEEETKDQPKEEVKTNHEDGQKEGEKDREEPTEDGQAKKKKKKKKNKKAGGITIPTGAVMGNREQDNSFLRNLGNWTAGDEWKQTEPPMIPISQQFKLGSFPIGEI